MISLSVCRFFYCKNQEREELTMNCYIRFPNGLRKAVTLSYDDGVETDIRLIDIMQKNGLFRTGKQVSPEDLPGGKGRSRAV